MCDLSAFFMPFTAPFLFNPKLPLSTTEMTEVPVFFMVGMSKANRKFLGLPQAELLSKTQ